MQTLDLSSELDRLFQDGCAIKFAKLQSLKDAYPSLEMIRDEAKKTYLCTAEENAGVDCVEFRLSPVDGAPVLAFTFVTMPFEGRLYSNPPHHVVGYMASTGFGVVPREGWREDMKGLGIRTDVLDKIADFLEQRPPISYEVSK